MKLKKSLFTLANRLKNLTEKEVQSEVEQLIYSYEMKVRYGAKDKLIALTNSIYTPTSKENSEKEFDLQEHKKLLKSEKRRLLKKNLDVIIIMLQEGSSYSNIAHEFSTCYVPNDKRSSRKKRLKPYYNKQYIYRYCRDNKLDIHTPSNNK